MLLIIEVYQLLYRFDFELNLNVSLYQLKPIGRLLNSVWVFE